MTLRRPPAVPPPGPLVEIGEPVERLELDAYREFVELAGEGRPIALVTVVGTEGSAPRGMGAAMAVREDGTIVGTVGGGDLEHRVVRHALEALADGRPRRFHYDFSGGAGQNLDKACVGKADFYVQPCLVPPRLHVFGAGHIGIALAPIAEAAGFRVTVLDDRPGFPDPARFPRTVRLVHQPLPAAVSSLPFDETTYIVIVTHGHEQDEAVLAACLSKPWRYLGMIGSRAKVARVFKSLGTDETKRKRLEDVRAPIGLDTGGRSPGEIAVSIAAELLAVRYGRSGAIPLRERVRGKASGTGESEESGGGR